MLPFSSHGPSTSTWQISYTPNPAALEGAGRVISTTAASHRVDGAPEATTAGYPSVIVISKYSSRRRRRSVSVVYRRTSDKWWWASGLLFVSWEEGLELQSEVRVYVLRKRAIRYITVL